GGKIDRNCASDLLLQRSAAFGRDWVDRGDARTGLPAGGFGAADDPANSGARGGADQSDFESGWPRQDCGLVLSLSQGQNRPEHVTAAIAAYWSKYTFVDINRDTHQQTHETTKA